MSTQINKGGKKPTKNFQLGTVEHDDQFHLFQQQELTDLRCSYRTAH